MGASGWDYYTDYDPDPRAVLARLHERVLAEGDYYWADDDVPRPATRAELHSLYEAHEHLAEEGTHSILDIDRIAPAGTRDDFGTIVALSPERLRAALGTERPTRAQFDAVYRGGADLLDDFPRWSGRCAVLYDDDAPAQIVLWGYSGD
ncbi:hypothetical protein [Actinokineospora fastidiosa]|uniref:Uncharacterized protein n=1 Tax=Actinokineospora fastidiosa TaxID=1816 RepID=A0A918LE00_9PSEU|nr:hypothetical protein [Actinokineospora fastidiosa]GGS34692.1 hypothetical protein GCM10010171_31460 [Actinokineospora fastidiosa]